MIGRRSSETEIDLLRLLAPRAWSRKVAAGFRIRSCAKRWAN